MQRVILFLVLVLPGSLLTGQTRSVDFRYAPASWFTAICFPDDWHKSVVTSTGTLGDDFAPGPYAHPLTEITFGAKGHTLRPGIVVLESPQIPIATAELSDETITVQQLLFAVVPSGSQVPLHSFLNGKLERRDGLTGCSAWASIVSHPLLSTS